MQTVVFIHGLEGSSQGYKAQLLRKQIDGIVIPDFAGAAEERCQQLDRALGPAGTWTLIGSSYGGLVATLWAAAQPQRVRRMVLLAPALGEPYYSGALPARLAMPVTIFHGTRDDVVAFEPVAALARQIFSDLTLHAVDDDHQLRATSDQLDWPALVAG